MKRKREDSFQKPKASYTSPVYRYNLHLFETDFGITDPSVNQRCLPEPFNYSTNDEHQVSQANSYYADDFKMILSKANIRKNIKNRAEYFSGIFNNCRGGNAEISEYIITVKNNIKMNGYHEIEKLITIGYSIDYFKRFNYWIMSLLISSDKGVRELVNNCLSSTIVDPTVKTVMPLF